jgi:acyl-CoA synthetase (AMP-forming)/AMP-acid ligase II
MKATAAWRWDGCEGRLLFLDSLERTFARGCMGLASRSGGRVDFASSANRVCRRRHPDDQALVKPRAYVVLRERVSPADKEKLETELKDHVRRLLPSIKVPRWIEFVDELPRRQRENPTI